MTRLKSLSRRSMIGLTLAAGLLAACSADVEMPAISSSGDYRPGQVVWRDLITPDVAGASEFYGQLFGWDIRVAGDGYSLILKDGIAIGGIANSDATDDNYWLPLVSVNNVDGAVARATGNGATALLGPEDLGARGRGALLRDPDGATFGVVRSATGDPADLPEKPGFWGWSEVWSLDKTAVAPFYAMVTGTVPATRQIGGVSYLHMKSGDTPAFGLVDRPSEAVPATWVNYVHVADAAATAARALELGGRVLAEPTDGPGGGTVAVIADKWGGGVILRQEK
ncbi:VOC family protein [Oceanomicrobium pacificus]|uniref:VOC domain-containing protein n=1 Tax=Oceanomicrobium pacificus TaxID=2692916 RepID=A0A6B0TYE7_9RHOB|nr:VOC family protein [Oceanomicrobium pacificus]MXU66302.1 hypothetical protein [Oceanomicrobium pacificus]